MDYKKLALQKHKEKQGKISIKSKMKIENKDDMSIAYTPGVAEPCREIKKDKSKVYDYTSKKNLVAVVSDGSAVLGLGNIGAEASMPVMEGKSVLFKEFANIDAFPICLDTQDVEKIVQTVKFLQPTFGGINLEDISSPRCVLIEDKLKEKLDIPVFHDDQHGTAVVVSAALINALKVINKDIDKIKIAVSGAGAAGYAITKMLKSLGVKDIIVSDSKGIIHSQRQNLNFVKKRIQNLTNNEDVKGDLGNSLKNADVFIGVSVKDIVTKDMIKLMKKDPIVFAMANPDPEILPSKAYDAGAKIVGTGRSDYPNQINNVLAFPGIFKGALDAKASDINEEMKIKAAYAIANTIDKCDLNEENIIPYALNENVVKNVSKAVYKAAKMTNVSRD
ncbi:MAG: NAD(P)-dependent malic enzyme [Bacillota bacterium]